MAAEADVCARCAGGNNAGHTIVANVGPDNVKTTFDFHLLPSGVSYQGIQGKDATDHVSLGLVNPKCVGLIGPGVVVHVPSFFAELSALQAKGPRSFDNPSLNMISFILRTELRWSPVCLGPSPLGF